MSAATMKPCNVCKGQHIGDNGRFCWARGKMSRTIKPTAKELRMIAARGITLHLGTP